MENEPKTETHKLIEWNIEGISLNFKKAILKQEKPFQMLVLHHIKYHKWNAGWTRSDFGTRVQRDELYNNNPDDTRSHYVSLCEDFRELQKRWAKGREYKKMAFVDLLRDIHISQCGNELHDFYFLPDELRVEGSSSILMYELMPTSGNFVLKNILFLKPDENYLTPWVWAQTKNHPDIHTIMLTQKGDRLEWTERISKSEWEKQDKLLDQNSMQCTYPTDLRKLVEDLQELLSKEFHLITEQSEPGHIFVKMNNGTYDLFLIVEESENTSVFLKYLYPNLNTIPNQDPKLVEAAIQLYVDTFQVDRTFRFRKDSDPGGILQSWLTRFLPSRVWDSEDIYNEITFLYVSDEENKQIIEFVSFEYPRCIGYAIDAKYSDPSPIIFTDYEQRLMQLILERVTNLYFRKFSQVEEVADINEYNEGLLFEKVEQGLYEREAELFEERQWQDFRDMWESGDNPYNFDDFN